MTLGAWHWLWLEIAVTALALVVLLGAFRHRRRLAGSFSETMLARVLPKSVRRRRAIASIAMLLGIALLVVAAAEPRFDVQLRQVKAKGVDLVLVIDLSMSMDAYDVEPSRLGRAKREVADLVEVLERDRVGLVVFAGGPWTDTPLTRDYRKLLEQVQALDTDLFQAQGSALGPALREAAGLLDSEDGAGRAVLVLSDGEVHDVGDAESAARELAAQNITVYAMGIGTDPTPIQRKDGTFVVHEGRRVVSTPQPEVLKELARITGGAYVDSVAAKTDIQSLYRNEMRTRLAAVERLTTEREQWREVFHWPLLAGLLLLLCGSWLGDGRRAFGAALALLLLPLPALGASVGEADALYRDGHFREAVEMLTELSLEHPGDPALLDRLGAARYRDGDFNGAVRAWAERTRLMNESDADTWFNQGNALFRSGRYDEALSAYDEALATEPEHPGATRNRQIVEQVLREVEPPPPQPKPGPSPEGSSEGQEQNASDGQQTQVETAPGETPPLGEQSGGGDPQSATPGEADPQDPTSSAEQPPKGGTDSQQGQPTGSEDQQHEGEPGGHDAIDPTEAEGEGGEPTESQGGTPPEDAEAVSRRTAHEVLDAVKEGRPRIYIQGGSEDRPW